MASMEDIVGITAEGCIDVAWEEFPDQPLLRSLFFSELSRLLEQLAIIEIGHQERINNERR